MKTYYNTGAVALGYLGYLNIYVTARAAPTPWDISVFRDIGTVVIEGVVVNKWTAGAGAMSKNIGVVENYTVDGKNPWAWGQMATPTFAIDVTTADVKST